MIFAVFFRRFLPLNPIKLYSTQVLEERMKLKSVMNLLVDLILFVLIIPVMLTRHQIHEIAGYTFGILILVHLLLHAKQLFALVKTWLPDVKIRQAVVSGFCVLCIGLTIWSFTATGNEREKHGFPQRESQRIESSDERQLPADPTE
jgi:protein-S-isoprenylcysteine O-methyltransferase Ste14